MEKKVTIQLTADITQEAANLFGAASNDLHMISDVANFVYECKHGERPFIMRITHSSHRSREQVLGELEWQVYLHANNIPVSIPRNSIRGNLVEKIDAEAGYFLVSAFDKIEGKNAIDANACCPGLYEEWGRVMGKIHALSKLFIASDPSLARPAWYREDVISHACQYLSDQPLVLRKFKEMVAYLHTLPRDRENYGLIHGDLNDMNIFVHEQGITVFDFDDSVYHWFVYDIAVILVDTIPWLPHENMERNKLGRLFWEHFMRGYSSENTLATEWLEKIPTFMKFREIQNYIFCLKKWDLENLSEKDRIYLGKQKTCLEKGIFSQLDVDYKKW